MTAHPDGLMSVDRRRRTRATHASSRPLSSRRGTRTCGTEPTWGWPASSPPAQELSKPSSPHPVILHRVVVHSAEGSISTPLLASPVAVPSFAGPYPGGREGPVL
jgi:hypothetical protein